MLQNAPLIAKIGVDTEENEPAAAGESSSRRGSFFGTYRPDGHLAHVGGSSGTPLLQSLVSQFFTIFHNFSQFSQFFGGSFSSVSTPIFTIKGAFCSIFRDLQNDLIEFSKFRKNFGNFYENSEKIHDFSGFSENFTRFCRLS